MAQTKRQAPMTTRRAPTRGLTEGAILAALTVIVGAAGLLVPQVAILLAPLPIMLLVIRWGLRTAVLASVVAGLVLLQFFGPLNAASVVAMFAPLGLTLGWGVRRGLAAQLTVLCGSIAFLATVIAAYAGATVLMHQDIIGAFIKSQVAAMEMAISVQQRLGAPPQQLAELRQMTKALPDLLRTFLPVAFVFGALLWSYLCYAVARNVLRRVGHPLPAVPPILGWRIPPVMATVLLWGSAALSLLTLRLPRMFGGPALDAMIVVLLVFGFQGSLVGIVWMNRKQYPRFMQIIVGTLLLTAGMIPIFGLAILGMLDTWFDYRRLTGPAAGGGADSPGEVPGKDGTAGPGGRRAKDGASGPAGDGAPTAGRRPAVSRPSGKKAVDAR